MNYNINLQMHVAPHVTVVKSSLCDVFARARAPIHGAIHGKTYHMLYLYMTQRRRVSFNFCV